MKRLDFNIVLWQEGKYYVAECLNTHVSSFGETKQEALYNINEALELYFEDENISKNFVPVKNPEIIKSSFTYV